MKQFEKKITTEMAELAPKTKTHCARAHSKTKRQTIHTHTHTTDAMQCQFDTAESSLVKRVSTWLILG